MATIKRLCVYCGSAGNVDPAYREAATRVGQHLAQAGIELVYGGGRIGLMGLVADAVLAQGGRVVGIIPAHLHDREVGHTGLSNLIVVGNMHERKNMMFEMSDAFAILPGGLGTLDEAFEIITWRQLSLHDKPVILVDVEGYWKPFTAMMDHVIEKGFAHPSARRLLTRIDGPDDLLATLAAAPDPASAARPDRF